MPKEYLETKKKLLLACALQYRKDKNLPVIIAHGKGQIAQKMVELAREYNIPIVPEEVEGFVETLQKIPLNQEIPPELYMAIARIYAYLYLEGKLEFNP